MNWIHYKSFAEIPAHHLYEILKLRQNVFIVEQNCIYSDIDDYDQKAEHLLLFDGEKLAGYARLFPANVKYKEASVGRIVVAPGFRNRAYGKKIVQKSIEILRYTGYKNLRIEAQAHLEEFYTDFGFERDGAVYDADGIPHIQMVLISE